MKIFLDTANLNEIKEAVSFGIVDGITTNPTLFAEEGNIDFCERVKEICEIVEGPVSVEVIDSNNKGMIAEARKFSKIASNVVVKIPMTIEGLKAVKILNSENFKTNVTLIFSVNQALLAAKVGATYVSPFIGRISDTSYEGINLIEEIITVYKNYDIKSEIITASIRSPLDVKKAALIGADISTVPFAIIKKMVKHPLTDIGIEKFFNDWSKYNR